MYILNAYFCPCPLIEMYISSQMKCPNFSTARLIRDPQLWVWDFIDVINYSVQKYFRKTKEEHSQKSASGHNWWSLFSLAVETLGLLLYSGVAFFPPFNFFSILYVLSQLGKCIHTFYHSGNKYAFLSVFFRLLSIIFYPNMLFGQILLIRKIYTPGLSSSKKTAQCRKSFIILYLLLKLKKNTFIIL